MIVTDEQLAAWKQQAEAHGGNPVLKSIGLLVDEITRLKEDILIRDGALDESEARIVVLECVVAAARQVKRGPMGYNGYDYMDNLRALFDAIDICDARR